MFKVYCGYNPFIMIQNKAIKKIKHTPQCLLDCHPRHFKGFVKSLVAANHAGFWTNNADIVRWFQPSRVGVIGASGEVACLTKHPEYKKWRDEMDSGEFFSMVGSDWVK